MVSTSNMADDSSHSSTTVPSSAVGSRCSAAGSLDNLVEQVVNHPNFMDAVRSNAHVHGSTVINVRSSSHRDTVNTFFAGPSTSSSPHVARPVQLHLQHGASFLPQEMNSNTLCPIVFLCYILPDQAVCALRSQSLMGAKVNLSFVYKSRPR